MKSSADRRPRTALALAAVLVAPAVLAADDAGWKDSAEFSLVATGGNTESTSLGLKNTLWREWERQKLTFRLGGILVDSTVDRFVLQGSNDIEIENEKTAESYYFNGRYDRKISDRLFWYAGAGWERNEFAGIKNRTLAEAGVGHVWRDTDDVKFSTTYGLTYTVQDDVVENPAIDDSFLGWRLAWDYSNKLGQNTTYTNLFIVDGNADESSDWRADMDQGIAVAMSERLALKVGLRLLYDHEPSLTTLDVRDATGATVGSATVPLDETDSILTASLVVNF